jgi:hypothetical protein
MGVHSTPDDITEDENIMNVEDGSWATVDMDSIPDAEPESDALDEVAKEIANEGTTDEEPVQKPEPEDAEEDTGTADDEPEEKQEAPKEVKRKSRAKERIQQLVQERNERDIELESLRKEMEELKRNSVSSKKESFSTQKQLLDSQIDVTKKALAKAIEDGNAGDQLELSDRLSDLKVDSRIVSAQLDRQEKELEYEKATDEDAKQAPITQLPEEMRYWIEDNPWVMNPSSREERKKIRALQKVSQELIQEGYSEADPEFYDELDKELEKEFGKSGQDGVSLDNKDLDTSSSQTENAPKQKKSKSSNRSPVSGAAATPASKSNKVSLTAQERALAKRMGISEARYAARKKDLDEKQGGWTSII